MKKIISLVIIASMMLSALLLVSCSEKTLSLGLGVSTTVSASDATEDANGKGSATSTVAAVLLDENGKIVKVALDCTYNNIAFTVDGKAVANESFKTKHELGADYNMKPASPIGKEWNEQADIFAGLVIGKTVDEVKALLAEGDRKGNADVIAAGCTMNVDEFVNAIEKAVANAVATTATASAELKMAVATSQTTGDATEDKAGKNQVASTVVAAAIGEDGKVIAAQSDCIQIAFTFDLEGKSTFDTTKAVSTKKELGDAYNMRPASPIGKEWNEQAAAFDAFCAGKTVTEIVAIKGDDGKGNADLQTAGCTMIISDFIAAVAKFAK